MVTMQPIRRQFLAILTVMLTVGGLASLYAEVRVTEVSVAQRWPWNGLVDITYSLETDETDAMFLVSFSGYDRDLDRTVSMTAVTGDGVDSPIPAGGPYTVTWDAAQDEPEFHSSNFEVKVTAEKPLYMVVNLRGGPKASYYPVRYSMTGPDVSADTCRTTELWLRRIPKGTFIMGSPESELGRSDNETQHQVTLTQDYYIGIFECTQRQYNLVTGTKPSYFNNSSYYATRPVEQVSYDDLRGTSTTGGAGWPSYGHAVDIDSFFGKLQSKTQLVFDLPTEAQWEYACRAGTTTALNSGQDLTSATGQCRNLDKVGRYWKNGGSNYSQSCSAAYGTAKVGSYLPNAWGLYDMHGNVYEWCLDWHGDDSMTGEIDPPGSLSGTYRAGRGGSWISKAQNCRSAYAPRGALHSACDYSTGFRIACLAVPAFRVKATGASCDKSWASQGETVMLVAILPDDAKASDYQFSWRFTPEVEFATAEAGRASFTMPDEAINVICHATKVSSVGTEPLWLVVDLSGGRDASNYSVRYSNDGPDLSDDACRTTELWLRRIPAGTFLMGSFDDELGRNDNETLHQVILSRDFYIGIFECTQAQWNLVYRGNPSLFTRESATRPVEKVSYDRLRGTSSFSGGGWPTAGHAVDATSFFGILQEKTGLTFDLPTEAQWEYACRAGTTTALNSGKNLQTVYISSSDENMAEVGRYWNNGGNQTPSQESLYEFCDLTAGTAKVGRYLPNAWGLYDMHGNVWEWCLDWSQEDLGSSMVENPVGPSTGTQHILRGGSWRSGGVSCRSAERLHYSSETNEGWTGFRIAYFPADDENLKLTVNADNAACDKSQAAPGETVTVTAVLPAGAVPEDYCYDWSASPAVQFSGNGQTVSFTMPACDVSISCGVALIVPFVPSHKTTYMVVDLSGGPLADSYPVRESETGPNLSGDTCRTTELWLRRIPAGTFTMGSPETEEGRNTDEIQHAVTLTRDYYVGVFEVTQRQWELVMATRPSFFCNNGYYTTRPVENVTYYDIRGNSNWPASGHELADESFLGRLQAKTGLVFDLPTEAQWEYACRAGTTTPFNSGGVGRLGSLVESESSFSSTAIGTAKVGSYSPNDWGLYDMHGNVEEWCLDWYQADLGTLPVSDPIGPESGTSRLLRGGGWTSTDPLVCRSAGRYRTAPNDVSGGTGLRIICLPASP